MSDARSAAPQAVWVFDVDGCLIDLVTGSSLRPQVTQVFEALSARGIEIVVWSAGGAAYAQRRGRLLGFDAYVASYESKLAREGWEGWAPPLALVDHQTATFVDDRPDELSSRLRVIAVAPYIAASRYDRGLAEVLERAEAPEVMG